MMNETEGFIPEFFRPYLFSEELFPNALYLGRDSCETMKGSVPEKLRPLVEAVVHIKGVKKAFFGAAVIYLYPEEDCAIEEMEKEFKVVLRAFGQEMPQGFKEGP